MYLEISNPMDYHVALYIRLSKEDETEGPSQSVTNQKSLLKEFTTYMWTMDGVGRILNVQTFSG